MSPVAVICIGIPIVAAFFWLSGYCFGRAAEIREFRRSGYQPAPGKLGTPPETGSVVYRGNRPPAPPPRPEGAPYPARPSR